MYTIFDKILVCDVEYSYKNISKIRNLMFILKNFQKHLQERNKNWKKFKWIVKSQLNHLKRK